MVLDSDSDSDSNEEDEEEYDQGRAGHTTSQSHGGYRPLPGDTRGGADEPIEIESSSDEEVGGTQNATGPQASHHRELQLQRNKSSRTNGGGSGVGLRELPAVNGGDANLNLSEDSSEDGEDTDKSMFDEKT